MVAEFLITLSQHLEVEGSSPTTTTGTRGLCYKTFYSSNCCNFVKAKVSATSIYFCPSLTFVGKTRSLLLELSSVRSATLVPSILARKY
jgi:hypothetical protein